jgi:hypothetical protein
MYRKHLVVLFSFLIIFNTAWASINTSADILDNFSLSSALENQPLVQLYSSFSSIPVKILYALLDENNPFTNHAAGKKNDSKKQKNNNSSNCAVICPLLSLTIAKSASTHITMQFSSKTQLLCEKNTDRSRGSPGTKADVISIFLLLVAVTLLMLPRGSLDFCILSISNILEPIRIWRMGFLFYRRML